MMDHKYTDEEVALILRKAGALQVESLPRREGLDLAAIQEIAAEAGIDPALVRRAAEHLARAAPNPAERLLGGPSKDQAHFIRDGEVSTERELEYVGAIRSAMHHQGAISEVLGALEWKTVGDLNQVAVTIGNRDGATHIDVIADRGPAAALTIVASVGGGMVAAAITGAITDPALPPAWALC